MANIELKLQKAVDKANAKTFKYNTKEAAKARSWEKQMSNTAHQREVADLIKAGLNPVLSSGGSGAASYSTVSASAQAQNSAQALASYEGSVASAKAQLKAARASAAATRYAAQQSAAATRAAAAQSAAAAAYVADQNSAATRYAADRAKEASIYHSDKAFKAQIYNTDYSKSGSLFGVIDKWSSKGFNFFKPGVTDFIAKDVLRAAGIPQTGKNISLLKKAVKNPSKYRSQIEALRKKYKS